MYSRETVEKMVEFMKSENDKTMVEKCKLFNMKTPQYYKLCYKYGIDGRIGEKRKPMTEDQIDEIIKFYKKKASSTEEYNSDQDNSE